MGPWDRCAQIALTWRLYEPVASVVPAHDDPPHETGQRQGPRFRLDSVARRGREMAPGVDGHRRLSASPRPYDLALDQDAARPDAWSPERPTAGGVGNQELAIDSVENEVGIAAREEPCACHGALGSAEGRLVAGEDPRVAEGCSHRGQRPAEPVERRDASPRGDPRPPSKGLRR